MSREIKYHIFHSQAKNISDITFYDGNLSPEELLLRFSDDDPNFGDVIFLVAPLDNGELCWMLQITPGDNVLRNWKFTKEIDEIVQEYLGNHLPETH